MHFYCIYRLTFIKSYDSGHSMPTVAKGLLSGEELLRHFSSGGKKKKSVFSFRRVRYDSWVCPLSRLFVYQCIQRDSFHLFQLLFEVLELFFIKWTPCRGCCLTRAGQILALNLRK